MLFLQTWPGRCSRVLPQTRQHLRRGPPESSRVHEPPPRRLTVERTYGCSVRAAARVMNSEVSSGPLAVAPFCSSSSRSAEVLVSRLGVRRICIFTSIICLCAAVPLKPSAT